MKKIKFVFLLFLIVFIFGCDQNKEPENPALLIFKEFESSQNVKMEAKLNIDEVGSLSLFEYIVVNNNLLQMQMSGTDIKYIYDLTNNLMYYNGYRWNGVIPIIPEESDKADISFIDYMSDITYESKNFTTKIIAKIDFKKMEQNSNLFENFEDNIQFDDNSFNNIEIKIFNEKVEYLKIYSDKKVNENNYIYFVVKQYGNDFNETISLDDYYNQVTSSELFAENILIDLEEMTKTQESAPMYQFELDTDNYAVRKGEMINISGVIYDNSIMPKRITKEYIKIIGDYDINTIGAYPLKAVTYHKGIKLEADFVLNVIDFKYTEALKYTSKTFNNSKFQFAYDNYYGICDNRKLYIYDLDFQDKCYEYNLNTNIISYYLKDNYLYLAGYEDYFSNYFSLKEDEFKGHIFKINLENLTIEKDVLINRYIYSIVVDKYNNVIFSKGHNGSQNIEQINLDTEEIITIKKEVPTKSKLLYDEESESIYLINSSSNKIPLRYCYDIYTKTYKFYYEDNKFEKIDYVDDNKRNAENDIVDSEYRYCFDIDGLNSFSPSNYNSQYFLLYYNSNITDEAVVYGSRSVILIYDKETKMQTNYHITNIPNLMISSVHYYNGKIYFFDEEIGELYFITK